MLAYRDGDADAFETLYRRHRGGLFRYFLRQCGNEGVAEELYQDVWMKLIRARERYAVKARFSTYLYHLAHNRLVDHYRRQGHAPPAASESADPEAAAISAADCDGPETRAMRNRQVQAILAQIQALPEAQREAFLLKEEAGLSLDEIARVTGVNKETAKSRLRYAVQRLRRTLTREGIQMI